MVRRSLLIAGLLVAAISADANAQARGKGPPARYQPSRPTVSPYLNLFRGGDDADDDDTGPLPNYYSLVRPQFQQIDNQQRQQAVNARQQAQIQNLDRGLLQITQPAIAPTGGGGNFKNYSHYFPRRR